MTDLGFWRKAQAHPDRVAIVDADGHSTAYGELFERQNRLSHGLQSLSLQPGDTVAVLLWNQPEFLELALACMQSGLYFLPINTHLGAEELAYVLEDSGAGVLVAAERLSAVSKAAADLAGMPTSRRFAVGNIPDFRRYEELFTQQSASRPLQPVAGATMLYTSGTTGRPKGVRRPLSLEDPDQSGTTMGGFVSYFCGVGGDDAHVQLVTGPLYHATPGGIALAGLQLGHTIVLMDKWTPTETLELIEKHGVAYLHVVPTMFHRLLELPESERASRDLSSLRCVLHGAAPCSIELKHRMLDWLGPIITEYYGSSEGGGTLVRGSQWLERPGTVGLPWPGSTIEILDEKGGPCRPGETGTIFMKMIGWEFEYHNAPDKTRESTRNGYFTVGDLGQLDEAGFLFLSGRSAELIISGGTNIYPAEIENCLVEHAWVADAAVFGVPNVEWGEEVKAVVELRPEASPSSEVAVSLIAHCREHLAGFKVPRSIDFKPSLPRNEAGKLLKRELISEYTAAGQSPY